MVRTFERICVFCGASPGQNPAYLDAARQTGRLLAERGLTVVYGGGNIGMMGELADAALAAGGEVIGIIPDVLREREVAHHGVTLEVVDSMHTRKRRMYELADAFMALPGGYGTLEELFETVTWIQLGMHAKPCGVLNVAGYYDPLLAMLDRAAEEGFFRHSNRELVLDAADPEALLGVLASAHLPELPKWVSGDQL
ncbi:MAG: TIGR00730 family Rossman fold protein [Acidobacteriota bacterium]